MRWIVLIVAGLAFVAVGWFLVMPSGTTRLSPASTSAVPKKFDTTGGQEMRPQWNR